jgi:hypothetical protein
MSDLFNTSKSPIKFTDIKFESGNSVINKLFDGVINNHDNHMDVYGLRLLVVDENNCYLTANLSIPALTSVLLNAESIGEEKVTIISRDDPRKVSISIVDSTYSKLEGFLGKISEYHLIEKKGKILEQIHFANTISPLAQGSKRMQAANDYIQRTRTPI